MNESNIELSYVLDCNALHEIAALKSGNLKKVLLDMLENGTFIVPTIVWSEFADIYEDEASDLKPFVKHKKNMKPIYHSCAASIAQRLNSGLTLSPYNAQSDLYVAAICEVEKHVLMTTKSQFHTYKKCSCEVTVLSSWVSSLDVH